jgi:hypothetical protein
MTKFMDEHASILSDALRNDLAWGPEESDARYNAILDLEDAGLLEAPQLQRAGVLKWRASNWGQTVAPAHMARSPAPAQMRA